MILLVSGAFEVSGLLDCKTLSDESNDEEISYK